MDCSLPASSIHGIFQARVLEWGAIAFSKDDIHIFYLKTQNPMNSMKRKYDRIPKEELPRSLGAQYATGEEWRNNSKKSEEMEPKQKQWPVLDVTGDGNKV